MLFQKITRSFCLGVILGFFGLVATLAQDQEPLTNADSRAVLFTRASPHPFKGIDPPFPPPKDFMSELLMNPKRTLVFMETDQATDTRFSLVRIVGGLPGGIPCVGGVNWPRGYEIVGEVPTGVDLTNDTIAKSLVKTGKAALFNFCPEASPTETVAVWLFKDGIPTHQSHNYEVYASWEIQLPAAPGPRIKAEYYNRALERAKHLAESRVRKVAPTRRNTTGNEADSHVPTVTYGTYLEMRYGKYVKPIIGVVLFVILLLILISREGVPGSWDGGGGYSSYSSSSDDSASRRTDTRTETDVPWVGGGFTGKKGEFTIIRNVERHSIPADSCSVKWEGNFGFVFKGEGKILESNIDGPTKMQMGNRVFEKNWLTGKWEEK
jgi:hypothetical protein